MRFRFGAFRFDSARCLLSREGAKVHLTRKAFLFLELLLEHRPNVVPKGRIMDRLWPDCLVAEGSLATLVSHLRTSLGEDGPALIRTVHSVGYAFAGEAFLLDDAVPVSAARFLLIEKGPPARTVPLGEGVILIGRSVECDARVASATVSRTHARIRLADGEATIEDLGSRNGTYLAGRRLEAPAALADGDEIRLGSVELVFREAAASESVTAPLE
jgi:DNA-binding winged helix-turn-helix (wHTH) protein